MKALWPRTINRRQHRNLRELRRRARRLQRHVTDIRREAAFLRKSQATLRHRECILRALTQALDCTILVADPSAKVTFFATSNGAAQTDVPSGQVDHTTISDLLVTDLAEAATAMLDVVSQTKRPAHFEMECSIATGTKTFDISVIPLQEIPKGQCNCICIIKDATGARTPDSEAQRRANHDPLTGLPNRRLAMDRLQQALKDAKRRSGHGAVFFIDLDKFKALNDTLGHDIGDLLLQQVGQRLQAAVRETDTVARLGGDEFIIILNDLGKSHTKAGAAAESAAHKILESLSEAYDLRDHSHTTTASLGIALFGSGPHSANDLIRQADLAMYQAKASGRNTLCFFEQEMQTRLAKRATLEAELKKAIEDEQFILHFQPQLDIDGVLVGAEALLRWRHPTRGMLTPRDFISLARDTGTILPIGRWTLGAACRQLRSWTADPATAQLGLSVNISAPEFEHPGFDQMVMDFICHHNILPGRLTLEITEGLLLKDMDKTVDRMNKLGRHGVKFAIDDFGTGYSPLAHLTRVPVDAVKIDRSFVSGLPANPQSRAIVDSIIALARNFNFAVIAEGIETELQRQYLTDSACDGLQGYLFGFPDRVEALRRWPLRVPIPLADQPQQF